MGEVAVIIHEGSLLEQGRIPKAGIAGKFLAGSPQPVTFFELVKAGDPGMPALVAESPTKFILVEYGMKK